MRKFVFFIYCSVVLSSGYSQNTERFYNISRRDGLASGSITAITQDHQGLMWIGTKHGINRFDGTEFIHFHTGNSELTSNDISSLLIGNKNWLWVGTYGNGVHKLNLTTFEIAPFIHEDLGNQINNLLHESDSTILILTNQGVARVNTNQPNNIVNLSSHITKSASAIAINKQSIWIGTNNGELFKLDQNNTFVSYSLANYSLGIFIQQLHPIDDQRLLIGTHQHGLMIFDIVDQSITKLEINALDIRDIIRDKNGTFWIGSDGHGIYKIKGDKITNYLHRSTLVNSLTSNAIQACFEDRNGNLWFGSAWDGLSVMDHRLENLELYYSDFEGVEESGVLSIYIENENLWFGTDGTGLSVKDPDKIPEGLAQLIPSNAYVQFIEKINGNYWFGTFQSGFFISEDKKNGKQTQYTTNSGLSHDDVRDVVAIDDHTYLIATWGGGLNVYDDRNNQFRKLGIGNGQPKDIVSLLRIGVDEILVGTFGQGVFLFKPSDFSCKRILEHLRNVVSIGENESGVWFGTWGEGLHFAERPFGKSVLFASEALPANTNIFSIIAIPSKNETWLATSEKIFRIDKLNQVQELPIPPQQYHINASYLDSEGRLYFGGTEGVTSFLPDEMEVTLAKDVEILEVKILDRSINEFESSTSENEHVVLNHDQNLITFRFTTPVYPSSRDESYEVLLKPLNSEWINVGRERSVTFADLNPGNYEFRVRNASSKSEKIFHFIILRPWWKTWWAYTLTSLIFMSLLYSFRRYSINLERIRNQLEIEKIGREKDVEISEIKQRFFVNISHEIRTPLTLIIGEIEHLASKIGASKSVSSSLNNLRNNGNHLIQLVNELLDFRKLDQGGIKLRVADGNIVVFCKEIYLSFLNKAEYQHITFDFCTVAPDIEVWYDRDQLEKVFYNLLSNAFKNTTQGGKVKFDIRLSDEHVELIIEDSGSGIPEGELKDIFKRFYQKENDQDGARQGFGIGLSIVQEIVSLHKGSVSVESSVGKGCKFIVKLKLGKDHFEEGEVITGFANSESLLGYDVRHIEDNIQPKKDLDLLIVEDNPEIRHFLTRILSERYNVQEASNGQEAYEQIQLGLPDLIISDVMMPEMDGITLTRKLKLNPTTSHIPIILLTARTGTVFKKEGFDTGADDYIIKPFNSSLLIARIENILNAREVLTSQIRNEMALRPDDLNLSTPDERFLKDLVQVVQNHLANSELNAELIAEEMGMSHSVVYKKIKALTGYNLVEFIRDYRLQQASEILGKYKFTVAEACYKVGFSDKKYFSQIFKKKFGVTPSEYSKNHG